MVHSKNIFYLLQDGCNHLRHLIGHDFGVYAGSVAVLGILGFVCLTSLGVVNIKCLKLGMRTN